jgi:hypothetical protein
VCKTAREEGRRTTIAALLVWLAAMGVICLTPTGAEIQRTMRFCLLCTEQAVPDILLNVLLYVPLGALVHALTGSARLAVALAIGLSTGIELLQLFIPGRTSSAVDLLSNTAGASIGFALHKNLHGILFPCHERARVRSMTAAFTAVVILMLPAPLLVSVAPSGPLAQGWTPQLGSFDVYGGRILSARYGGQPAPEYTTIQGASDGSNILSLSFVVGPEPSHAAVLYHLADQSEQTLLLLLVHDSDIVVQPRFRANDFRMAVPDLRADQILTPHVPGDTVSMDIEYAAGGRLVVRMDDRDFPLSISSARGWSLLRYYRGLPDVTLTGLDVAWTTMLVAAGAFWAPTTLSLAFTGILVCLALLASSAWPLISPPSLATFLGVLLGLAVGRALRFLVTTPSMHGSNGAPPRHSLQDE